MDGLPTPPVPVAGPSQTPDAPPSPQIPPQPAFFYPSGHNAAFAHSIDEHGYLSPDQDPLATRGIPVFKPTYEEFADFEGYMTKIDVWGKKSGIVKVIPPKEWRDALPSIGDTLPQLQLRHPIEQHMMGQSGLFRQNNVEKRKVYSLKDWADLCTKGDLKAPPIKDGAVVTRVQGRAPRKPRVYRKKGKQAEAVDDVPKEADPSNSAPARAQSNTATDYPTPQSNPPAETPSTKFDAPMILDPAAEAVRDPWYTDFNPFSSWLPQDTQAEDYTPEVCRELERVFWRTCGLGAPALYGADMPGSLFNDDTKHWNVASLPSFLSRLCSNRAIPGVNTPYLYFGMWRATFAWHVEDMDLYSINYVHWGAPKYWYAIPSGRAKAFEGIMKGYFPGDAAECPQYLRHKAFMVSPTLLSQSSCRPNTLVQHQGEFVITYPRGYHAGFNLGLNCAESVNFALESWVELGRKAGVCRCVGDSVRIDVDALLAGPAEVADAEGDEADEVAVEESLKRSLDDDIQEQPKKKAKKESSATEGVDAVAQSYRIRIRLPPIPPTPCCLCVSDDKENLLRVQDPPTTSLAKPFMVKNADGTEQALWQAHERCARAIPETWVDIVDGENVVFGVDAIMGNRWALKCTYCTRTTLKAYGAKIQCTKGKCPKAFHVSCAMNAADIVYKELGETEKDVLLMVHGTTSCQSLSTVSQPLDSEPEAQVVKTIKKPIVELICHQHNPVVLERKRKEKLEQLRKYILALPMETRVRIRNSAGVCEVTLLDVNEGRETVTVAWSNGERREFSWTSIVCSQVPEGTTVRQVDAKDEAGPSKPGQFPTMRANPSPSVPPAYASSPAQPTNSQPHTPATAHTPRPNQYQYFQGNMQTQPYSAMRPSYSPYPHYSTYYPPNNTLAMSQVQPPASQSAAAATPAPPPGTMPYGQSSYPQYHQANIVQAPPQLPKPVAPAPTPQLQAWPYQGYYQPWSAYPGYMVPGAIQPQTAGSTVQWAYYKLPQQPVYPPGKGPAHPNPTPQADVHQPAPSSNPPVTSSSNIPVVNPAPHI